jgi:hypothetical protein
MRRWAISLAMVLCFGRGATAQQAGDYQVFTMTAIPVPTPALKYELLVDPIDREAGNAADVYRQAWTSLPKGDDGLIDQLFSSVDNNSSDFESIAALCQRDSRVFELLEKGSRAETCDWKSGYRLHGGQTLLPHLHQMRTLVRLLALRAHLQVHRGKLEDAIATIQLGYELGRKTGSEPILISGLIGIAIVSTMQLPLEEVMNRPESPNLYWALATLPRPMISFQNNCEAERLSLYANVPGLAKARSGEMSVDQWADVMERIAAFGPDGTPGDTPVPIESLRSSINALLPHAQEYYAQAYHLSADEVAKIDPIKVVGVYGFAQYQNLADEQRTIVGLDYPQLIPALQEFDKKIDESKSGEMGDTFAVLLPSITPAVERYVKLDRQIAALTGAEAIRDYAAANDGKLPAHLSDMTDMPAPPNPRTGKPFEYSVQGDEATLSDDQPADYPLKYIIRIAK